MVLIPTDLLNHLLSYPPSMSAIGIRTKNDGLVHHGTGPDAVANALTQSALANAEMSQTVDSDSENTSNRESSPLRKRKPHRAGTSFQLCKSMPSDMERPRHIHRKARTAVIYAAGAAFEKTRMPIPSVPSSEAVNINGSTIPSSLTPHRYAPHRSGGSSAIFHPTFAATHRPVRDVPRMNTQIDRSSDRRGERWFK